MCTITINYHFVGSNEDDIKNIFSVRDGNVYIDEDRINTNMEELDPDEREEANMLYEDWIKDGDSHEVARVRAALFFSCYCDTGFGESDNQIKDHIVLYLLGLLPNLSGLSDNVNIYVKDDMIYTDPSLPMRLPVTGTECVNTNFGDMFRILMNDAKSLVQKHGA